MRDPCDNVLYTKELSVHMITGYYLESVHNVGKVQVRVALIHQLVEHLKCLNLGVNILPKSESMQLCHHSTEQANGNEY